ncbi:MAG: ferrous iron transporter B [Clostridia bacterium]|nr:ferrous iron transporter B [Clostridia bacterium]
MCKVALVGNPNCGKSTIFNRLTNSNAKVGNRAGVTVSVEQAKIAKTDVTLCDLAGFYSLDAFTTEEQLSVAFLSNVKKVINVVDCTRLERSLHLTNQLVANGFDVMVALTMCDEASKLGLNISTEQLENKFNIPFVKVQANIGLGLEKLCQFATTPPKNAPKPVPNVAKALKDANVNTPLITMQKADKLLLGKFAFVFLALILLAIFFLAVGGIAQFLTNSINNLGDVVKKIFENSLLNSFAPVWQSLLLCVCDSVFLVLSFTPQIVVLFLLLTLLEDTGYMARISFLCDKPLSTLGLSGHSAISLLLATGCAVFA